MPRKVAAVASSPRNDETIDVVPSGTPLAVETAEKARGLVGHLLDPRRRFPVVVISVHPDHDQPFLDAPDIAAELKNIASVVVMGAEATYGLTQALGDKQLSVFYGAGRVYPVGTEWLQSMYAAPLLMCPSPSGARRARAKVLEAALTAAHAAGVFAQPTVQAGDRQCSARVSGPMGDNHVLVRAGGRQAVMLAARLAPGVPAERLVRQGQTLAGRMRGDGWLAEFFPDPLVDSPLERVRAACPDGSVVLARVERVAREHATLLVHPAVRAELSADADTPDLVRLLPWESVVPVTIHWIGGRCRATLADGQEDSAVPVPVIPGGPAWLLPEASEPAPDATPRPAPRDVSGDAPRTAPLPEPRTPHPSERTSATGLAGELDVARTTIAQLAAELEAARAENDKHLAVISSLKKDLRRAGSKIKEMRSGKEVPVYSDPAQQFRHDVGLAYLRRVAESDRATWPLPPDFGIGSDFIESLDELEGIDRGRVLDVVVEVLTGRARDLHGILMKPWLETRGGVQASRRDGSKAWRVSLQQNAPGARRLKFWRRPDNSVELDSVGHHDAGID